MLTHFDHVTIAVADVGAAVQRYTELLGCGPVWRGGHPELGAEGAVFGLANAAIELTGPRADAPEAEGLRALLAARGEGLSALAFGTDQAARASAAFRERGLRATAPEAGEAHGLDGSVRHYQSVQLSTRTTRGLSVLAVERPDPNVLRAPGKPAADAVAALDHIVIRTSDANAAIALYGEGLGIRLALDRTFGAVRMLFFRIGGVTLEVVEDPSVSAEDRFYGLTYRVDDLERAHARLAAAGFEVSETRVGRKPGTHVFSVRNHTCGVPTLFLRDPSRDR